MTNKILILDLRSFNEKSLPHIIEELKGSDCCDVMIKDSEIIKQMPSTFRVFFYIKEKKDEEKFIAANIDMGNRKIIPIFDISEESFLEKESIYISIKDEDSMSKAILAVKKNKYVFIESKDPSNIPLELLVALSQKNKTFVCKLIETVDDGWNASMIIEEGCEALLLKSNLISTVPLFKELMDKLKSINLNTEEIIVKNIHHLGLGDRACIDTTSILGKNEGILVGSTSSGFFLVSSETHFLPFMELRPFRVNAGAVHSYVICPGYKTKYISELKAGDEILAVDNTGKARIINIGRVKIEKRPLLLVQGTFSNGIKANIIIQDDWHIRFVCKNGNVVNSTLVEPTKTKIVGLNLKAGRHLGHEVDETIIEN